MTVGQIKMNQFEVIAKLNSCYAKTMWHTKDITPDLVPTNCQGLLAKLLSFTTEIGQRHRVIENSMKIGRNHSRLRKQ